jgi:CspA family cold shock protein
MTHHRSKLITVSVFHEGIMAVSERLYGTVKSFDSFDGAGTISIPDGREAIVRYSSIRGEGIRRLREGTPVSFQLEQTRRGLYAVAVQQE